MPFSLQNLRSFFGFSEHRKNQYPTVSPDITPVFILGGKHELKLREYTLGVGRVKLLSPPVGEIYVIKSIYFTKLAGQAVPKNVFIESDNGSKIFVGYLGNLDNGDYYLNLISPVVLSPSMNLTLDSTGGTGEYRITFFIVRYPDV